VDGWIPNGPILVVDDDLDYRILARHQLEAAGYLVLDSADARSACTILTEQPVRLVILDIVMPDVEGLEIIRRLRREGCRSRILAVSGAAKADEYLELAVRLGADAKFEKGSPAGDLLAAVQGLIGTSSAPRNESLPESA
jgi:CheY-like chemotaxis protein